MNDEQQAAVWYWHYHNLSVDVGTTDEIIGEVLAMADAGDCSPQGVQYPDGTYNDWDDDPNVKRIEAVRAAYWAAEMADAEARPPRPTRVIKAPWKPARGRSHSTARVDADTPEWVGARPSP